MVGDPLTGRRVWFTETHTILVIFFTDLFIQFILDIKKKTSSVYDCTVEDVEYICNSNSTLVD